MNDSISITIGKRINTLLAEQKKLQKELANFLGVQDNTISYFVSGRRTPNIEQIVKISEFFNVTTDYLLGKTPVKSVDTDINALFNSAGLSEETSQYLLGRKGTLETLVLNELLSSAIPLRIGELSDYLLTQYKLDFVKQVCLERLVKDENLKITDDEISKYGEHILDTFTDDTRKKIELKRKFEDYCRQMQEYINFSWTYRDDTQDFLKYKKEKVVASIVGDIFLPDTPKLDFYNNYYKELADVVFNEDKNKAERLGELSRRDYEYEMKELF